MTIPKPPWVKISKPKYQNQAQISKPLYQNQAQISKPLYQNHHFPNHLVLICNPGLEKTKTFQVHFENNFADSLLTLGGDEYDQVSQVFLRDLGIFKKGWKIKR